MRDNNIRKFCETIKRNNMSASERFPIQDTIEEETMALYSEHVIDGITTSGDIYFVDIKGTILEFYFPDGNKEDILDCFMLGTFDDEIGYELEACA